MLELLTLVASALLSVSEPAGGASCSVTAKETIDESIAAAHGQGPVWMVDGGYGRWAGPDVLVKTVWIVAKDHPGELVVSGRRIDAEPREEAALGFVSDRDAPPAGRLRIPAAQETDMLPGGIDPDTARRYAFRPSYLVYPSPGCWELEVSLGSRTQRIVVEQR